MSAEKRRVLILDDDPLTLKILTAYLRAPAIDLVVCSEIEAAECLMNRDRFDVLVTDLEVSDLGGVEGIRLVRHVACHFPNTKVIVYSGKIDHHVRQLAIVLGVLELLEKPAGLRRLRDLVHEGLPTLDSQAAARLGDVTHVETMDELLQQHFITAVLQPIISLDAELPCETTLGFEGLTRGAGGSLMRSPEVFLEYASRKGKLFEIEMQCIDAVLAEGTHLSAVGKLFINTRPLTVSDPGFVSCLRSLVGRYGYRESDIVLELTEQQSVLNVRAFDAALEALRAFGFGLALDDYGSGFANLHLLRRLRLDYLKIDGRFSSGIHDDRSNQAIVRSTVELAQELGIPTIIEHVETEDELEAVQELGVNYAQGYRFSAPAPGPELARSFQPVAPTGASLGLSGRSASRPAA